MYFFRLYSYITGIISIITIPKPFRNITYKLIGKILSKMNKNDFKLIKNELKSFSNIRQFFIREIKLSQRAMSSCDIVSPCDGKLIEYGNISNIGTLTQVKGIKYQLDDLLLNKQLSEKYTNGSFFNIYLSPRNYHRFHAPCQGTIRKCIYIPGLCYPVNKWGQKKEGLYTKNSRYVVDIENNDFSVCFIAIGAAAVRGIEIHQGFGDYVNKGDEIGYFELGSSIVLLSSKKLFPENTAKAGNIFVFSNLFY